MNIYPFEMPYARQFTFGPYRIDPASSSILFTYSADLESGLRTEYADKVIFPGVTEEMWQRIPDGLLSSLSQSLVLVYGITYWRLHLSPNIRIEGFSLTKEQSQFWNELYTKDLGEFFYRSKVDFRGLISFPYEKKDAIAPVNFPCSARTLLAIGGGKDSIVSAEMLKKSDIAFDLLICNSTGVQERVATVIGKPKVSVIRRMDLRRKDVPDPSRPILGYPSLTGTIFESVFAAVLHDYRYIIFSNEQSSDISNINYLGLDVNHQWCKSTEAERLIGVYIARFITPDPLYFSLLRRFSELEVTRRFTKYPKYLRVFSSCNMNLIFPRIMTEYESGRGFWCKRCPKCAFMFACLTAFLKKQTVIDIVGANLYANPQLATTFRELLGLEGHKPFECVGAPEEMIVAMGRAKDTRAYDKDIAMQIFNHEIVTDTPSFADTQRRVFSPKSAIPIPEPFASRIDFLR